MAVWMTHDYRIESLLHITIWIRTAKPLRIKMGFYRVFLLALLCATAQYCISDFPLYLENDWSYSQKDQNLYLGFTYFKFIYQGTFDHKCSIWVWGYSVHFQISIFWQDYIVTLFTWLLGYKLHHINLTCSYLASDLSKESRPLGLLLWVGSISRVTTCWKCIYDTG